MAEPESLCVYCRRQRIDPASRPFCSERCRMADLGRWLSGDYQVAGEPESCGQEADNSPEDDAERARDN